MRAIAFLLAFGLGVISSGTGWADEATHEVVFKRNGYAGKICINHNRRCSKTGSSFELAPGDYQFWIASGNSFGFRVDETGDVTSMNTGAAKKTAKNVLSLQTTKIKVDFGDYRGSFSIANQTDEMRYNANGVEVVLLKNLSANSFSFAPSTDFAFDTDINGDPEKVSQFEEVGEKYLRLATVPVTFNPGKYRGTFWIRGAEDWREAKGSARTLQLVPGVSRYLVGIAPSNDFRFHLDEKGVVSTEHCAAAGRPNGLKFITTELNVQPDDRLQQWEIVNAEANLGIGTRGVILMPEVEDYILSVGPRTAARFDLNREGKPSVSRISVKDVQGVEHYFTLESAEGPKSSGPLKHCLNLLAKER